MVMAICDRTEEKRDEKEEYGDEFRDISYKI